VWASRPLYAGLLVGGKSSRMGSPKQLLRFDGRTLGEIVAHALSAAVSEAELHCDFSLSPKVAILGAGAIPDQLQCLPRVPDAPGLAGPIAGLLAAHRWAPRAAWVLAACDHPWLSAADIRWLIHQRRPGTWAVLPRQRDDHPYPTLALYEPQALTILESALLVQGADKVRIAELFNHPRTLIAPSFTRGLVNVNTPQELTAQEELAEVPSMWSKYRLSRDLGGRKNTSNHAEIETLRCSE
jgi:molybdopterin-guanine dinucleotide biosynthesis protein A